MGIAEELSAWLAQHPKKPSWDTQAVGEQALRNTPRGGSHRAGEGFSNPIWRGFMDNPIMPSHPAGTGRGLNIGAGEFLPPAAFMDYSQKFADQATNGDAGSAALSLGIAGLEATGLAKPLAAGMKVGAKYGPKMANTLWDMQTVGMKSKNEPGMWDALAGYGSMQTAPQGVMNNGIMIYPGAKTWNKGQARMRKKLEKKHPEMSEAELINRTKTRRMPTGVLGQERPDNIQLYRVPVPSELDRQKHFLEETRSANIQDKYLKARDKLPNNATLSENRAFNQKWQRNRLTFTDLSKKDKAYRIKFKKGTHGKLGDLVTDSGAVQNFPGIKDFKLQLRGTPDWDGTLGWVSPKQKRMMISENSETTAAHELQHAAQAEAGVDAILIDSRRMDDYSDGVMSRLEDLGEESQQIDADLKHLVKNVPSAKIDEMQGMQQQLDNNSKLADKLEAEWDLTPFQRYQASQHEMEARRAGYVRENNLTQAQLNYTDTYEDWIKKEEKRIGTRQIWPEPGQIEYDPYRIRGIDF